MSRPLFTINFRREAFERDQALARRRLTSLVAWMAYFGVLALAFYAYSLNYTWLRRHTFLVERQIERFSDGINLPRRVQLEPAQIQAIERVHTNPARWRDRMVRLAALTPPQAVLTSVAVNPGASRQPLDLNKLVISGRLSGDAAGDPMRGIVQLLAGLQADSAFAAGYQDIKLTRSAAGSTAGAVEFTIECR